MRIAYNKAFSNSILKKEFNLIRSFAICLGKYKNLVEKEFGAFTKSTFQAILGRNHVSIWMHTFTLSFKVRKYILFLDGVGYSQNYKC